MGVSILGGYRVYEIKKLKYKNVITIAYKLILTRIGCVFILVFV